MVSLTPAPPTVIWTPAPSLGRSPCVTGCLHSHLPCTRWGLPRTVALAAGAAAVTAAPLFLPPRAPRLRDHRKATMGCATLAWPGPEVPSPWPPSLPGPRPRHHSGLSKALSAQDHRGHLGGLGCTARGASWASPHHPGIVSVPHGLSSPSPMSCQCHYPQGATSPAACPLVPVALPCVVSRVLPQRLGWLTLPSHLLTPWGVSLPIFECDFKVKK